MNSGKSGIRFLEGMFWAKRSILSYFKIFFLLVLWQLNAHTQCILTISTSTTPLMLPLGPSTWPLPSSYPLSSIPSFPPSLPPFFFLNKLLNPVGALCMNTGNLLVTTPLKRTDSPFPSILQLPIAPHLGWSPMGSSPIHAGVTDWLGPMQTTKAFLMFPYGQWCWKLSESICCQWPFFSGILCAVLHPVFWLGCLFLGCLTSWVLCTRSSLSLRCMKRWQRYSPILGQVLHTTDHFFCYTEAF